MGLRGDGVLVGEDGVAGGFPLLVFGALGGGGGGRGRGGEGGVRGAGVDGGDDGEVVLEAVEVVRRPGEGAVERVEQGGVEGPEGEFVDEVREVEGCGLV